MSLPRGRKSRGDNPFVAAGVACDALDLEPFSAQKRGDADSLIEADFK
jgi:hypothetical protein